MLHNCHAKMLAMKRKAWSIYLLPNHNAYSLSYCGLERERESDEYKFIGNMYNNYMNFFSLLLIFLHSFLWNYCVMLLSSSWCYSLLLYSFYIYCLFMIPTDFVLYDLHHPHYYYYYYLFVSCFVGNVRTTSYYVSFCWYYLDQYRHHHDLHLE